MLIYVILIYVKKEGLRSCRVNRVAYRYSRDARQMQSDFL